MESDGYLPLRLISIRETLDSAGGVRFSSPTDWQFHVISHTWTRDLRDWSVEIATRLKVEEEEGAKAKGGEKGIDRKQHGSDHERDHYADLFEQENFQGKKGYEEFREFLRILEADGVEKVWFDALCINQEHAKEKDREILRMGAYYSRSAGCYVWSHGVGGGFRLWKEGGERNVPEFSTRDGLGTNLPRLPRWFYRVWTLQEYVLPSKLAIIVGMDKQGCTAMFSYRAYCRSTHRSWIPSELIDDQTKRKFWARIDSGKMINSRALFPCPYCLDGTHVYYVEREQHLNLLKTSCQNSVDIGRTQSNIFLALGSPRHRLETMLAFEGSQRAVFAIQEISMRECSEGHDEDRLLSILGLLKVEGKVQVRSGKRVEEQILDVAKNVVNEDHGQRLLLLLCVAQFRGDLTTAGMSWASTLTFEKVRGDIAMPTLPTFKDITKVAELEGVSASGLSLRCPFLKGWVVPFVQHRQKCSNCVLCQAPGEKMQNSHFVLEVAARKLYSLHLWGTRRGDEIGFISSCSFNSSNPTCRMALKAHNICCSGTKLSFPVWLLLLAQDQLPRASQPYGLFMVCVGNDTDNLHRIGLYFNGGPRWNPGELPAAPRLMSESTTEQDEHWSKAQDEDEAGESESNMKGEEGDFGDEDEDEEAEEEAEAAADDGEDEEEEEEEEEEEAADDGEDEEEEEEAQDGQDNEEEEEKWEEEEEEEAAAETEADDGEDEEEEEEKEEEAADDDEDEEEEWEEEEEADGTTWKDDVESMEWGGFIVGGFGEFVPTSLLNLD